MHFYEIYQVVITNYFVLPMPISVFADIKMFWQMLRETLIIETKNLCSGNAEAVLRTVNVRLKQNTVF